MIGYTEASSAPFSLLARRLEKIIEASLDLSGDTPTTAIDLGSKKLLIPLREAEGILSLE